MRYLIYVILWDNIYSIKIGEENTSVWILALYILYHEKPGSKEVM